MQDPIPRFITATRLGLAPIYQCQQHRQFGTRQFPGGSELGEGPTTTAGHQGRLLKNPRQNVALARPLFKQGPAAGQEGDVLAGVLTLSRGQGPLQPVRLSLVLGQLHPQQFLNKIPVSKPESQPEHGSGFLGINQRLGQHPQPMLKHLQILAATVQYLDPIIIC